MEEALCEITILRQFAPLVLERIPDEPPSSAGCPMITCMTATTQITLVREEWHVPANLPFGEQIVVPLRAGERLHWRLEANA